MPTPVKSVPHGRIFLWAHRGASAVAPENTLAAFRAAEEAGADGIEFDVRLSRDGVPVVLHDADLDRTTDGRGPVSRRSSAELSLLDAGRWFGEPFAGEPLPTLADVLDWAGSRLRLNLELKGGRTAEAVLGLLSQFPAARPLVSSFQIPLLRALRGAAPLLPLAVVSDRRFWGRALAAAAELGAEAFHPRRDRVDARLVARCRRLGLRVNAWTVDLPQEARRLAELGVDGLFTNDPVGLRAPLESLP